MKNTSRMERFQIETDQDVIVKYGYDTQSELYKFDGVQYPSGWTSEDLSSDEVPRGEVLPNHILEGRKKGAVAEANAYIECLLRESSEDKDEEFTTIDGEVTPSQLKVLLEEQPNFLF